MSTRQIATATLWQIASQVTMAALSIVTVKFVALGLTKELAGNYNSAYGYLQLFGILADFGLYAVSVREVSRSDKKEDVLGALLVLRSIILVLSLASALIVVWLIPAWRGTPLPLGVTIAALVPFFTLLAGIMRTVFQVSYKMQYVFIAEVTQRILTAGMIGYIVLTGVRGSNDLDVYHHFLFIGGIGAFVLFALSFFFGNRFMRIRPQFDPVLLKRLLKAAMPFGVAFLCMALYRNLDITLIALLRDDFELQNAYYGFVIRMADMGYLLPTFLLNSTLPILSERDAKGEDTRSLLGKTFLIILILSVISCLFSFFWARPLVQLLTTDAYLATATRDGSDTALRLLAIPMFLNGIVAYSFYVLLTRHYWKRLMWTLLVGAAVSLVMNLALIPSLGFVGAGYTAIAVHVLLAALLLPQTLRVMPMSLGYEPVIRWLAFTGLLALALFFAEPYLTDEIRTAAGLIGMTVVMAAIGFGTGIHRLLLKR